MAGWFGVGDLVRWVSHAGGSHHGIIIKIHQIRNYHNSVEEAHIFNITLGVKNIIETHRLTRVSVGKK